MSVSENIRSCWDRTTRAIAKRPDVAKVHRTVTARMVDGLTCEIEAEGQKVKADMPEAAGGNAAGLPASTYAEISLASCLCIGYRMLFASQGVPVNHIEVTVSGNFDIRGMYGVGEAPVGFDGPVTYGVHVDSPANEEVVVNLINQAEAHSPIFHAFTNPVELKRELHLTRNGT